MTICPNCEGNNIRELTPREKGDVRLDDGVTLATHTCEECGEPLALEEDD